MDVQVWNASRFITPPGNFCSLVAAKWQRDGFDRMQGNMALICLLMLHGH